MENNREQLYINHNDMILKVQDMNSSSEENKNTGNFNINEAIITDENEVYIYKGIIDTDNQPIEGPYLYFNSDSEEYECYGDSIGCKDDCYTLSNKKRTSKIITDDTEREKLFTDIMSMEDKRLPKQYEKKNESETKKQPKEKVRKRLNNDKRIKRDEVLNFEINDQDDMMVKAIKEKMNEAHLTMEDLYDLIPSQNNAYNLFYGLSTRNTMSWKIFTTWCEILNLEVQLIIRDKN